MSVAFSVALGGTTTGGGGVTGLTQSQVDARIRAGVKDYAETRGGTIATADITDGAITQVKLAAAVVAQLGGGGLSQTQVDARVSALVKDYAEVGGALIDTADVADDAITEDKLAPGVVSQLGGGTATLPVRNINEGIFSGLKFPSGGTGDMSNDRWYLLPDSGLTGSLSGRENELLSTSDQGSTFQHYDPGEGDIFVEFTGDLPSGDVGNVIAIHIFDGTHVWRDAGMQDFLRFRGDWVAGTYLRGHVVKHSSKDWVLLDEQTSTSEPGTTGAHWTEMNPTSTGGLTQSQVDARVQAGVSDWAEQGNTDAIPATKLTNAPSGGGGLNQGQVDARVQAGVEDWAETGNTSAIPANKLTNAPSGGGGLTQDQVDARIADWAETGNTDAIPADKLTNAPAGGGGLNQGQVDARVQAGVLDWAEEGNTDQIPANKLGNAPSGGSGGSLVYGSRIRLGSVDLVDAGTWYEVTLSQAVPTQGELIFLDYPTTRTAGNHGAQSHRQLCAEYADTTMFPTFASAPSGQFVTGVRQHNPDGQQNYWFAKGSDGSKIWIRSGLAGQHVDIDVYPLSSGTVPPVHTDTMYAGVRAEADGNTFVASDFTNGASTTGTQITVPTYTGNHYIAFAVPATRGQPTSIRQPGQPLSELIGVVERQGGSAATLDIAGEAHIVMRTTVTDAGPLGGTLYEVT